MRQQVWSTQGVILTFFYDFFRSSTHYVKYCCCTPEPGNLDQIFNKVDLFQSRFSPFLWLLYYVCIIITVFLLLQKKTSVYGCFKIYSHPIVTLLLWGANVFQHKGRSFQVHLNIRVLEC